MERLIDGEFYCAPRKHGFGRRLAIVALSLACAAFTYRATVDVLRWRFTPTSAARGVLGDPGASERQRIDAAVIVYNDTANTIEALESGEPAQECIIHLENLARRATQAAERAKARARK